MGSKRMVAAVLAGACVGGSWARGDDSVVPMVWAPLGADGGDGVWDVVSPNFIVSGTPPMPPVTWMNDGLRSATFNAPFGVSSAGNFLVDVGQPIVANRGIVVNGPYTFLGDSSGSIDIGGGSVTTGVAGVIVPLAVRLTGVGGLTVSAPGSRVELMGGNTYVGGTTLNAGTLKVWGDGALGDPSGVLTVNGTAFPPVAPPAFPPDEEVTVQVASSQTVGGLAGTGGVVALDGGATLTVNQQVDGTFSGRVTGPGTLVKTGVGTLTTSVGTFWPGEVAADVSVAQGTLLADQWFFANRVDIAPGAMLAILASNTSINSLSGTGTLDVEGVTDITPAAADSFGGQLVGVGAFHKHGPAAYSLTGTYEFGGTVWSDGGPLTIGPGVHAWHYGLMDGATLNVPVGAPLLIKPAQSIDVRGGATSQPNTLAGSVECQGYLRLFARPALPACLRITGDLTFGYATPPGGIEAGMAFYLDPAAGGVADELVVDGALTIAGPVDVLPVSLVPGAAVLGSSYALIEYGSFEGVLNDPAGLYVDPSWASRFMLVDDPAQHTIFLVSVPEPGVLAGVIGGGAVMLVRRRRASGR